MKKLMLLLMLYCCAQKALAQAQQPDPAQQQALDKITYAIKVVFNKLNSADWTLTHDYYDPHMSISYQQQGAPLGFNNNFERQYELVQGSPTYVSIIQPLLDHKKALAAAQKYDSLKVIDHQIYVLSHFSVYANINMATVGMGSAGKSRQYQKLSLKGCTYCGHSYTPNSFDAASPSYDLLFGNWDTAACDAAGHTVSFKFKHPAKTPFIENVDIKIIGDNPIVQKLLNNTDWNIITGGLTT
jgi:hypothetical protein